MARGSIEGVGGNNVKAYIQYFVDITVTAVVALKNKFENGPIALK